MHVVSPSWTSCIRVSQQIETTAFSPGKRALATYALGCAVFDAMCYGVTDKETKEDQDENDIEDFVWFLNQEFGNVCHS